ncbi:MAG: translation initiation factor [Tidjanibacter sp.]|nr:translation initiation factor [Tidjanibacter sp.]
MAENDWKARLGVVFSTNPDFNYTTEESEPSVETLPVGKQNLRVWIEHNHRGGKTVTLVKGFVGGEDDLKELARELKNKCGVGGSVKDGEIIIQGSHRERVVELLVGWGYVRTKPAGGK